MMLNTLAKALEIRGYKFIRYADKMVILFKIKRVAERIMGMIIPFIENYLFLKVSREKSQSAAMSKVNIAGYSFYKTKGESRLRTHPKSVSKLKAKIGDLTSRGNRWGNVRR